MVLIAIGSALFSIGLSVFMVVRIPADYFCENSSTSVPRDGRTSQLKHLALSIGRNLIGVVLVLLGIVMSFPGVPGQGILMILLGIMLTDIPGKRRVELAIIRRPGVRRATDKIRARFDRAPLEIPPARESIPS